MIVKKTPLSLLDFKVTDCEFYTLHSDNEEEVLLEASEVGLDFDLLENKEDENILLFHLSCKINQSVNAPKGYKIHLQTYGVFYLEKSPEISDEHYWNYKHISTLNIMIGNIRGVLRDLTAYGVYGAYQLPSLDMNDLLNQKASLTQMGKPKKLTNKKKN